MNRKQSVVLSLVVVLLIFSSILMGFAEEYDRESIFYVLVVPELLAGGLLLYLLRDKNSYQDRVSARVSGTDKALLFLVALGATFSAAAWSSARQVADNAPEIDLSSVAVGFASVEGQLDDLQSELERIRRTLAFR